MSYSHIVRVDSDIIHDHMIMIIVISFISMIISQFLPGPLVSIYIYRGTAAGTRRAVDSNITSYIWYSYNYYCEIIHIHDS